MEFSTNVNQFAQFHSELFVCEEMSFCFLLPYVNIYINIIECSCITFTIIYILYILVCFSFMIISMQLFFACLFAKMLNSYIFNFFQESVQFQFVVDKYTLYIHVHLFYFSLFNNHVTYSPLLDYQEGDLIAKKSLYLGG